MRVIKLKDILEVDNALKERVRQWRNNESVRKSMLTQDIITKDKHSQWLENLKNKKDRKSWIIFIDDTPIGSIYLHDINYEKLSSEWGFYIGEDIYRGKGLAKNILFEFLKMFFENMNFETLFTKVLSINGAALNIYNKFSFKEVGRSPFNEKSQIIMYKFNKDDWKNIKDKIELNAYKERVV